MTSILVMVTSGPGTGAGQQALRLMESLMAQGHTLTVCCLQDAALLASHRPPPAARDALGRLLGREGRLVVVGVDLAARGLQANPDAAVVDHAGVVALLAADHHRVIGAL